MNKNKIEKLEKETQKEKEFFSLYCDDNKYGEYSYLISNVISTYRDVNKWINEFFPFFEKFMTNPQLMVDCGSFEWKGKVCFRNSCVMILDEKIFQIGRKFPCAKDVKGENVLNDDGEFIEDINYIQEHYTEFLKVSWIDFIPVCEQWVELLKHKE